MNLKLQLSATAIWFILALLAIVNGTVREFAYKDIVGEYAAHVISTIILMLAILGITYLFLRLIKLKYGSLHLLTVGLVWVVMTILFEFGFGHYVMGNSWERLFADYNIFEGRVWILIPITTLFAPLLMGRLAKSR